MNLFTFNYICEQLKAYMNSQNKDKKLF